MQACAYVFPGRPVWDTYDEIAQYKVLYGLGAGLLVWTFCVLVTWPIAHISFFGVPVLLWLSLRWYVVIPPSYPLQLITTIGLRTVYRLYVPLPLCFVSSVQIKSNWSRSGRPEMPFMLAS
jgi:hypothetical protein